MSESLGNYLQTVRRARRFSLRQVEKITEGRVSNAYLSQIENGHIQQPSVLILHTLSAAYGIDFGELCERACIGNPRPAPPPCCPTCGQPLWNTDDDVVRR